MEAQINEKNLDIEEVVSEETEQQQQRVNDAINKISRMRAADMLQGMKKVASSIMHIQNKFKGNYRVAYLETQKYCQQVVDIASQVSKMEKEDVDATGQVQEPVREVQ